MTEAEPRRGRRRRSRRPCSRREAAPPAGNVGVRRGVIKWFNRARSYGFIQCEDGSEVFVHESAVVLGTSDLTLAKGREVEFEVRETPKGQQAVNVVVVNGGATAPEPEAPTQVEAPSPPKPQPVATSPGLHQALAQLLEAAPGYLVYTYTIYDRHHD